MEEKKPKKLLSSKVSIVGLFAMLTFILTVPLALMLSQQQQTFQQHAAEPTAVPAIPTIVIHNQTPGYIAGYIAGYIYKDDNQNGQRDPGEKAFPGVSIKVTDINKDTLKPAPGQSMLAITMTTDENGYFKSPLKNTGNDLRSYLLQVVLPSGYKTIDTNPLLLPDISGDTQKTVEFGLFTLKPISIMPSITCSLRPPQCLEGKACPFLMPKGGWCPSSTTLPLPTQARVLKQ